MLPKENISTYYPESRQLGLFLDVDNFLRIAKDGRDFDLFINAIRPWGKIALCRAYGNSLASRPQLYCQLLKYNFLLTTSAAIASYKKNGADIQITVEVMEAVHTRPAIRTFVIASGDSDFLALVESLHQYQKTVIGVGSRKNTSPKLTASCDAFLYYEDILHGDHRAEDLRECSVSCKTSPEQMKSVLHKRGLYPPEPLLRRKILSYLEKLRKESYAEAPSLRSLQEKLIARCHAEEISSSTVRNLIKVLIRIGLIVPSLDLPTAERPVLPLPDAEKLEESICSYLLDVLLQEPELVADPIALSETLWGDTAHVRQIQNVLKQECSRGFEPEKK